VINLPKTVTRQRRDCDLNQGPSAPESNTLTTRLHVATYLRCGGVVNSQIKKGLLLSLSVKKIKIGKYWAKLQTRTGLYRALFSSFSSAVARCTNCT